ncbi:hypothetical protein JYU34_006081 [Plutella xylostella]|uniref:Uncharacterized protein n=1 Tax=Plutella xylostella TaxID=51655 RepID=A0ABQ7QUV8_PLUXY|nr:hypothetical protein JYU34_006081 [Plutella xylostella]
MIAFAQNSPTNMIPDGVYYEGQHGSKFPGMQLGTVNAAGFMGIVHASPSPYAQAGMNVAMSPGQGQYVSGIDPTYLTAYSSNNAAYIANGGMAMGETNQSFSAPYQNRNYAGVDRNKSVAFSPQASGHGATRQTATVNSFAPVVQENVPAVTEKIHSKVNSEVNRQPATKTSLNVVKAKQERENPKNPEQTLVLTRADRLKAIHKGGPRAFSGPVEKVLKWHKALQDIGVLVIYEIVAKCVSVKSGDSCAKHLVIRDAGGPAMQAHYYEVDFLLPDLTPPCTVSGHHITKCVLVKSGDSCAKHLVIRDAGGPAMQAHYYEVDFLLPDLTPPCTVRDAGGPAMQAHYYEVDFLLPDLTPPCTQTTKKSDSSRCVSVKSGDSCAKHLVIRDAGGPAMQAHYDEVLAWLGMGIKLQERKVVGRMIAGSCRLQAFNVRIASGDDVATLPRRAAVAAHHVAKLCNELNINLP